MKKILVSVCIFAIIAFSFTGVLIHVNNAKISKENENDELNNEEEVYEENHTNDYKLATTEEITFESGEVLKENSIIFEDIPLPGISEGNIFQIKGLKNEKVQDRINNDIKNKVNIKISDISKEENFKSFKSIAYDIEANFSNITSAIVNIKYMQKDDSENDQHVYLNYELVNGNRLKLSDLLKKDTEITDIVREYLYNNNMNHYFDTSDIYYDRENDIWRSDVWSWEYGNEPEQKINKTMLKFEKSNQKNEFFILSYEEFVPDRSHISEVYIIPEIIIPGIAYLNVGELPGKVTAFKKYLTSESLYKDDTIAEKNKISNMLKTIVDKKNSDLVTDNFYYKRAETFFDDRFVSDICENGIAKYSTKDNLKKVDDKYIEWFFDEVEKCKEIALKDPNNFYAIISTSHVIPKKFYIEDEGYLVLNTFEAEMGLYKIVVPIEQKNEIIETIYDVCLDYRRENDLFWNYYTYLFEGDSTNAYSDKLIELSTEHLVFLSGLYDVRTLQPVESITEHDEEDFNVVYVLPGSDKVKIAKSDIENFSLDELNKAYNEIFARHGHDFTNKELKNFFWGMIWYTPISGKTVSLDELSEVEKYNLNIIKEVIAEKEK